MTIRNNDRAFGILGKATVDLSITTDQPITLNLGSATKYILGGTPTAGTCMVFVITNCGSSNTGATGALYRTAAKANALTGVTTFTGITGTTTDTQRVVATSVSVAFTANPVFFAMTAAGTGTADVYVFGIPLP